MRGDWQAKLLLLSQIAIGFVAFLGVTSMASRRPILMLFFAGAQGLIVLGVVLFAIVAVTTQRAVVSERYRAGEVILRVGDLSRYVYVIRSGTVDVATPRGDGTEDVRQRGPGDHFGEMTLVGRTPQHATVTAVTGVDVLKLTPNNFVALYTSLPAFKEQFRDVLGVRAQEITPRT
jgi:CRP-like cAMP-binding protein